MLPRFLTPGRLAATTGFFWLALLAGLFSPLQAAGPPSEASSKLTAEHSPLALLPAEADFYVEIRNPRRLAETVQNLDALEQLRQFPAVREQLDSTSAHRFFQLLAFFEKKLGHAWPGLLDRLAGNGIALAGKLGNAQPALLVLQGKDEKTVEQFVPLLLEVIEGELARQEAKDRPVKETLRDTEVIRIGEEFFLARVGPSLLVANRKVALVRALDLAAGRTDKSLLTRPGVAEANRLLPEKPLVHFWLNMAPIQASPQGKELYRTPRDNGALTVLFGHYLDVLGRTPFVTGGLFEQGDGFLVSLRVPRGKDGGSDELALATPPAGQPGSLPLLEPRQVIYSDSFFLDVSRIWTDREKLFPEKQAKDLERFDKTSGRFLAGNRLSDLLSTAGTHHRTVVVNQEKGSYKKVPRQKIPAFAFVAEMREPEKFSRAMGSVLRAAALLASFQFGLKMEEESHQGVKIVSYHFDEAKVVKQDVNDVRFNFTPCFAPVGDQFIFCSTVELCRELVDLLHAEQKTKVEGQPQQYRARVRASGVASLLRDGQDQLITQTILDQGVPIGSAREQVQAFLAFVRGLGTLSVGSQVGEKETRYEFQIRASK